MNEEVKEIAKYFLPKQSTKFILKPKLESILYIPEGIFTLLKTYNEPYVTVIFNENRLFFTDSKNKEIQSYRKNIEQKLKIPNLFDNNLLVKHTGECFFKHDCTKENKCFKSGGIIGKTKNVELKTTSVSNIPLKIMNNVVIKKKRKNFEMKMKNTDDVINKLFGLDKKIEAKTPHLEKPTIQPKKIFYYKTKMSWYECRELFLKFSKEALTCLIKKKNIPLFIDNNFNLFSKKPLKTKEKKKSRLGINFNILRESLRLIQLIDQSFSYEKDLALYRYKYKTMKQLKYIKEINYMYNNIKSDETPFILHRNVWLKFFGGIKTYLHENLKRLLDRIDKKREKKQKSITKQRIESKYDLDFTTNFLNSFADEEKKKAKLHLTEAIKHFKSAKKYTTGDTDFDNKLECAIKIFEKDYLQKTKDLLYKLNYKKIEKVEYKKLIGRLNRLDLKKEKNRQLEYLKNGPDFNQVVFYEDFLKSKKGFLANHLNSFIDFPDFNDFTKKLLLQFDLNPEETFEYIKNIILSNDSSLIKYKRHDYFLDSFYFDDTYFLEGKFISEYDMVDEFLVKYLKVFFVNKRKNYTNSWLEKKKVDIQNMKCYQMKLFNWIDFNILRRILNTFLEGNVVSYIIKRLNSNIIYKDIEYSNNFGLFKSKLGKLIYNILLLVMDNILMQSDDTFYYRIEDKIYSENILIPSYLNDFIVQKETLVFNDYLINENGEPLLLSSEYLSILELKLKKLIRNCNCLSFGTVASKWNDFLKNQKINNQSLPIFKKYQSKVLDCIKRGVSSRMSTRFPLLIFYTPKNLGGLGLYNLIEPTPIITDFDTPTEYFTSIVEYFGGEKKILEHSLYYFLDKVVDFENQNEPETKVIALKRSIYTLPNKKFIMWWSPTINRSRVYVGKKSLDLTGITMYGKLNSLKVNYVHLFRNHIWDGIHKKCKEYFPSYIKGEKSINNYFYNSFDLSESNNKVNEESNVKQLKVNFKIIWSDFDTKEINGIDNGCLNVILNINYNSFVLFGCIFSEKIDELKERCREALKNKLICILRDRFFNFFETSVENRSIKNDFDHLFCTFNEDVYLFEIKTGKIIHRNITGRKFRKQKISEIIQTMIREDIVVGVDEEYYQEIKDIIFQKAKIVKTKDKINFNHLLKELDTTNVYDKNWTCDSYTKYCRVALLCKALELEPTIKTFFIKNKAYIPMNDEEWIEVEYKIKDLIEKYYIKNYFKPLDQGEMKEIVFNKKPFVKKLNLKKWKPLSMLERKIVFYNSVDSWLKNFNIEPSAKNLPYDLLIKIITVNKSLKDIFIYKIEDFYVLSFFPRTMIKFKDTEWEIKETFNIRYIFNQKYDDYDILIDESDVNLKVNLNSCEFRWLINLKNTDEFINRFPIESDFQ